MFSTFSLLVCFHVLTRPVRILVILAGGRNTSRNLAHSEALAVQKAWTIRCRLVCSFSALYVSDPVDPSPSKRQSWWHVTMESPLPSRQAEFIHLSIRNWKPATESWCTGTVICMPKTKKLRYRHLFGRECLSWAVHASTRHPIGEKDSCSVAQSRVFCFTGVKMVSVVTHHGVLGDKVKVALQLPFVWKGIWEHK